MSAEPILASLLPDTADRGDDDVTVGGVSLRDLAATYGTPLFVYDEATLRSRCREAASVFDDGVAFASKSFLCGAMARLAFEEGLCIDVATGGELDIVLRAGVPAEPRSSCTATTSRTTSSSAPSRWACTGWSSTTSTRSSGCATLVSRRDARSTAWCA